MQLPPRELGISYRICMDRDLHSVIDGLCQNVLRHEFSAIENSGPAQVYSVPRKNPVLRTSQGVF